MTGTCTGSRIALFAAALLFSAASMVHPSAADEDAWKILHSTGEVTLSDGTGTAIAPAANSGLPIGTRIQVSENGRMRLQRGKTVLTVEGNSDIELRETTETRRVTIFQRLGEILLDVEPRRRKHFEVDTPHLTAVVKGTKFIVAVAATGSTVLVKHGSVEVSSKVTNQATLVGAGQTARVGTASMQGAWEQAERGDSAATSARQVIVPGRSSGSGSYPFDFLAASNIGWTLAVALAAIVAIFIAVSDAFAARTHSLARRVIGIGRPSNRP